jgi:hypothetical protein
MGRFFSLGSRCHSVRRRSAAVASQADAEAYLRERFLEIFPLAKLA